ncbi:MAG: TPR repeat protein [Crocinitomicaceae bacterium]|jgi:TPR repeat protein
MAPSNLGNLYMTGKGVELDYQKASDLYKLSADGGESMGMMNLAIIKLRGLGEPVDKKGGFSFTRTS